jgi:hypothetical protein
MPLTTPRKTLSRASIALAAIALVLVTASSAFAGDRVVRVRDACDPSSFNAAIGPGTCERSSSGKRVDFGEFFETLADRGSHSKWYFKSGGSTIRRGDDLVVRLDQGGEFHSFTEVAQYGPGCVPEINAVLGLSGPPAADCALMMQSFVAPGAEQTEVSGLSSGVHRFECLIHPWMQTTITVR